MENKLILTEEETNMVYESMRNMLDRSDSEYFYDTETDTEYSDSEKFMKVWNSIMDKL